MILMIGLAVQTTNAQGIWGTTSEGGDYGAGTIYKTDSVGRNPTVIHEFLASNDAIAPYYSKPCMASIGKIYGTTSGGGRYGRGVLYEFDPVNSSYNRLHSFSFSTGQSPYSDPIQGSNGKLYGLTQQGGQGNRGALYEYDLSTDKYKILASLQSDNAEFPYGRLVEGANQMMYGTTTKGGDSLDGVLFAYDIVADSMMIKYHFGDSMGRNPRTTLIKASNGKMYGLCPSGGRKNYGVIFEFNPTNDQYRVVHHFIGTDGSLPYGAMIEHNGRLYGQTFGPGGGTLFYYDLGSGTHHKLEAFNYNTGSNPYGDPIYGGNSKIYGVTSRGGLGEGTLYEYDLVHDTLKVKHRFTTPTGVHVFGSLAKHSNGKLYGTSQGGGAGRSGTLFEYDPTTEKLEAVLIFRDLLEGGFPRGQLIQAKDKKLYGMTQAGGINGQGVIYRVDPATGQYTKLVDLIDSMGTGPNGALLEANDGDLYGMTTYGGQPTGGSGTIFRYNIAQNKYTKLVSLDYNKSGIRPHGELIQARNGHFYGMAGWINRSSIFEYRIGEDSVRLVHDFVDSTGRYVYGSLIEASDGLLYGMTRRGGEHGNGVIFSVNPNTYEYALQASLIDSTTGSSSFGSLLEANNGKLYGMTYSGGGSNQGTLIEYDPQTGSLITKVDFDHTIGRNPQGSLMQAHNGMLYAHTGQSGTFIEYDIDRDTVIKTFGFTTSLGTSPVYGRPLQYFENPPCVVDTAIVQAGATLTASSVQGPYQWIDCENGNTPITGETGKSFTATQNGSYAVIVGDQQCSDTTACKTVSGLGWGDNSDQVNWSVHPNPTQGRIQVVTNQEIVHLRLVDLTGKERVVSTGSNVLEMSDMPAGMYILEVAVKSNGEQTKLFTRILKQD